MVPGDADADAGALALVNSRRDRAPMRHCGGAHDRGGGAHSRGAYGRAGRRAARVEEAFGEARSAIRLEMMPPEGRALARREIPDGARTSRLLLIRIRGLVDARARVRGCTRSTWGAHRRRSGLDFRN